MGRPYSLDLRERVISAVRSGMSRREAAEYFSVGISSAIRWAKRERETGSPAALAMGGASGRFRWRWNGHGCLPGWRPSQT
jgi:transposase